MRKFLFTIVILILLALAALFAFRLYGDELTRLALVPTSEFQDQPALADNAYVDPAMWYSRPGMGAPNDPARWQPSVDTERSLAAAAPLASENPAATDAEPLPRFAVFFVHPTSFYPTSFSGGGGWNAPLADEPATNLARRFVRGMASAFNPASEIWVPRYRQAAFGAFLSDDEDATLAIDAAYRDVALAFDYFVATVDSDLPIVLAGHSQGSVHLLRLLQDRIVGTPLETRLAMVYPIGWPISVAHDLPALGVPACATAQQTRCVVSWASFAEPAEPGQFLDRYAAQPGADGQPRGKDDPILCVNPLTGNVGGVADMSRNYGTLVPNADLTDGSLVSGAVPARCDPVTGLLLIGDPPELGSYVLPGNNYHTYDIPLFWANLRADVTRRMRAFAAPVG